MKDIGILHIDIRPQNIYIKNGKPYLALIDFGNLKIIPIINLNRVKNILS